MGVSRATISSCIIECPFNSSSKGLNTEGLRDDVIQTLHNKAENSNNKSEGKTEAEKVVSG